MVISLDDIWYLYKLLGRIPIPHGDQDQVLQVSKKLQTLLRERGYPA